MKLITMIIFLLFTFSSMTVAETKSTPRKELAIVIDDLGNNMKGTEAMLNLPISITAAIMPFLSTTTRDAKFAHEKGHEVIIHLLMEPKNGKKKLAWTSVQFRYLTLLTQKRVVIYITDSFLG